MSWSIPRAGRVEVLVDATPEQIWPVLTDVRRVGEWSHECRGAQWLDGSSAVVGARFRGRNTAGVMRWGRPCTVTDLEPTTEFGFQTHGGWTGDSTAWLFRLERDGARTRIVQTFQILSLPRWLELVIVATVPKHRDRLTALSGDLARLGELSGSTTQRPGQRRSAG